MSCAVCATRLPADESGNFDVPCEVCGAMGVAPEPQGKGCMRPDCHCVQGSPQARACAGKPTVGGYALPTFHRPGIVTDPTKT